MFGISGVCNVLGAIKTAKFYGMGPKDTVVTVLTDGIDRYRSVMADLVNRFGPVDREGAALRYAIFQRVATDYVQEGTVLNKDRWFKPQVLHLGEQQGKTVAELNAQKEPVLLGSGRQAKVAEIDKRLRDARGKAAPPLLKTIELDEVDTLKGRCMWLPRRSVCTCTR
jgi:hypothetical protein